MTPLVGPPLTLKRLSIQDDGAFGYLFNDDTGNQIAVTCERTFGPDGSPTVVVPTGRYLCQRGEHQLEHGGPFITFEITGVANHSGILFHTGNTELDSTACVLLGTHYGTLDDKIAILESKAAFDSFMQSMGGFDQFWLNVEDS